MSFVVIAAQPSASDALITKKVVSALSANSVTQGLTISVSTTNGKVILSGTTNSDTQAATAVQIAESIKNVKDVDTSNLNVQGGSNTLSDTYITAKVKGLFVKNNLFMENPSVPATTIKVETQQGVVYLSGRVTNKSQIREAIKLAKSVNGVTKVVYTFTNAPY
jgi:hyperosmotically inducible protein